ncbi:MAG TPA: hypothetical protein VJX67_15325, partial [Blastocatellia bacterium]|nr:hypothetical protein [Blastocatellia bacterium]
PEARTAASKLEARSSEMAGGESAYQGKATAIMGLEIEAAFDAQRGEYDSAIELMKKALAIEAVMSPPSGPPEVIKPPRELYGEILLAGGRAKEAEEQFDSSLMREPNRARSLIGKARSAARSEDRAGAFDAYKEFLKIWDQADSGLAEVKEAAAFLSHGLLSPGERAGTK